MMGRIDSKKTTMEKKGNMKAANDHGQLGNYKH